jgi:Tfp pilus assembly protein PilN
MSLLSVSKRRRPVTGLDVSADQVVAAMVDAAGELHTASRPLPPGLVHEGEVRDAGALAAELRALFAEHKLSRSVRLGLASPRLVVRRLELPAVLRGNELDAAVRFQAADVLPGALDEVVLDYRALDAEGDKRRVVIAAARHDIVGRWRDAVALAGLKLEGIDLAGFALARRLASEVDPDPASSTLLVHLGDIATMAIVEGGATVFARATAAGAEPAAEARSAVGFHAGAPGAHPLGRVVLTGVADDWAETEAAFEQLLGAPVYRDRGPTAEGDRFIIATGLATVVGGVSVDLRPGSGPERDRLGAPTSKRRALAPAVGVIVALFAGMGALYVQAGHSATARVQKADRLEAQATTATAQAASLQKFETLASQRASLEGAVRQIAGGRLDWAGILRDVARYTPGDVELTSLRATVAPGVSVTSGSGGSGGAGGGTQSLRAARTAPAVELTGCAANHPGVSRMLGQMRRVRGVTLVSLAQSERLSGTDSSSAGGDDCRHGNANRSLFQMVLFFENAKPILPPDAGSTATPAAATTTTPSTTPTTSTTPSAPATGTTTTGSGQ